MDLVRLTNLERIDLGNDSYLESAKSYLDEAWSEKLMKCFLENDFPWEHQQIRGIRTKRANAWFAASSEMVYRYSGQTWYPHPLTVELEQIGLQLSKLCNTCFNSVLAALYPNGSAGVSWHDDNDFPALPDQPIATISFGARRRFKVRRKSDLEIVAQCDIDHGTVVVMGGAMQRYFDHTVTKTSREVGPRINLSYRCFHTE